MNGDLVSGLIESLLFASGMLFAAGLGSMYRKDGDKRKLMFTLAMFLASFVYLPKIGTVGEAMSVVKRLRSWGALPMVFAIFAAVLSSLLKLRDFDKPLKAFLLVLAASTLMVIVPLPFTPDLILLLVTLGSIAMSIYLYVTKRETSVLMLMFSTACFMIMVLATTMGLLELAVLATVFAYVFLLLVFATAKESGREGTDSLFALGNELKSEKEKFEKLFNLMADPVAIVDGKGKILEISDRIREIAGYEKKELLGKNFLDADIVTEKSKAILLENLTKTITGMPILPYEVEVLAKDEKKWIVEVNAAGIEYEGKPAVLVVIRNIAERKRMQEELAHERDLLQALMDNVPDAIYFKDVDSRFTKINKAHAQRMGLNDAEEAVGKRDFDFYAPEFAREAYEDEQKIVRTGKPLVNKVEKIRAADGRVRWVSATKMPIVDKEGRVAGIVGVSRDITELKRIEEELRSSEERFRILFEFAPDAYYLNDLKGKFIDGNRAAEEITGYNREELIGKNFLRLRLLPRSQIPKATKLLSRNALGKSTGPDEFILERKDGTQAPVEIMTFPVKIKDQRLVLGIARNITERKRMEEELRRYSEHLKELVYERTRELKDAQEQLLKAERLAAIGETAAMVGHDLRNPLTGIAGATYYLKKKLSTKMDEKTVEMLGLIDKNIEHSNEIINELLEYSREIRLEKRETTPESIIRDALSIAEVPKNIQVLDVGHGEAEIEVDVEKMKRVFVNIIKNAIDAMPEGGKLMIESKRKHDNLVITFADTGTGMSKDVLDRLWTPFFTTKSRGMGLGLPICKRIVEAHNGKISAESTVGKGTAFTVNLPIKPKLEEVIKV